MAAALGCSHRSRLQRRPPGNPCPTHGVARLEAPHEIHLRLSGHRHPRGDRDLHQDRKHRRAAH
eukprot:1838357-Heterocapsa_arctica.AAC.1